MTPEMELRQAADLLIRHANDEIGATLGAFVRNVFAALDAEREARQRAEGQLALAMAFGREMADGDRRLRARESLPVIDRCGGCRDCHLYTGERGRGVMWMCVNEALIPSPVGTRLVDYRAAPPTWCPLPKVGTR
jgi:hypothetical protein